MKNKKPVPNSLRMKYHSAKTVASLVSRLPIQSKLDASQDLLAPLTPIWHAWYTNTLGSAAVSTASTGGMSVAGKSRAATDTPPQEDCFLKAINRDALVIACTNASKATLIKSQATSLLTSIHQQGYSQIKRVRVVMELPTQSLSQQVAARRQLQQHKIVREKPSDSAIQAVESAANASSNSDLSNALTRLANTLRRS